MKKIILFLPFFFLISCQITETIHLNSDGSGNIEVSALRDENSYLQLAHGEYSKEEIFRDSSYVFNDYITKYAVNFSKLPASEKAIFNKYKNVKWHIKESSFEKEFRCEFEQDFVNAASIPDLYKTEEYAGDLKNNYALSAEDHYFNTSYFFDGTVFKRIVKITDTEELKKKRKQIEEFRKQISGFKLLHTLTLEYHFPRNIKSVSNEKAIMSSDKQSLKLILQLLDCQQNPEIGNLEVILE